jgi:hypothetical protein
VIRNRALSTTIIAIHEGLRILEFRGHRLAPYSPIQIPKLGLHIRDTSAADRTLVVPLGILKEAFIMNAVAASHKNNGIRGREHVLAADGTIALGNAFDTAVSGFDGYRHAGTARLNVSRQF